MSVVAASNSGGSMKQIERFQNTSGGNHKYWHSSSVIGGVPSGLTVIHSNKSICPHILRTSLKPSSSDELFCLLGCAERLGIYQPNQILE